MSQNPSDERDLDLSEVASESPEVSTAVERDIADDGAEGGTVPEDDAQ